ncbi:Bifunctional lysine-specific demethylase and histidyl-hydroxylase NO66 [Rhynchospora pubera]|uniref:Bifunctional lysine-specific demethylase and histidyl-hydroxylase n=1 Tax=Rhynchospora pubera TaxID=906938 RepID=A0AAV8HCH2_9POAL|nr:Bifunctional lysine-specific demethylase and histidyl-hydroxylase NO66 [Rhynchospora pubera]
MKRKRGGVVFVLHLHLPLLLASAVRDERLLLRRLLSVSLSLSLEMETETETETEHISCLLAVLPLLLRSRCPAVAALAARLVGAASLASLRLNHAIAADAAILTALLNSMRPSFLSALLDLSVSSFARHRLRHHHHALPHLLFLLSQHPKPSSSLLRLILLLINTSTTHFFATHNLSPHLLQNALPLLSKFHNPSSLSYIQTLFHDLSQTIFWISAALPLPHPQFTSHQLSSYIFGTKQSDFQHFLLAFWEKSPLLIKKGSNSNKCSHQINSLLTSSFNSPTHTIIDSILQNSLTCPATVSDDLDLNQVFNEIKGTLGSSLIYNQDIRILKTNSQSHCKEQHFPFIDKWKKAFQNGYSIALKGMQFRSDQIAPFSLAFSELFGLPSIGVNLYLSPSGAQGLARHYDDHCVFVWQIRGCKCWKILKDPKPVMPRLYESIDNTFASQTSGEIEIILQEGDILYIPRGYFHEARTVINSTSPSLHLTFAIEVERPFEWEGFVHVALHCWSRKLNQKSDNSYLLSNSEFPNITHTLLLHISIKLIGDQSPAFRKLCMVASNFKMDNQKSNFDHLINIINEESNFIVAFNWIKLVVEKREEESILCMRWLRNLYDDIYYDNLLETLEKYVVVACNGKSEEALADFVQFKSWFCKDVVYEDACASFLSLLKKYRESRRQYMKGMLSLHRKY